MLGQRLRERILVTDDDPVSCQLFAEVLEGEGYEVDRAQSGEDAVRRLHDEAYALLLVDVRLPGMRVVYLLVADHDHGRTRRTGNGHFSDCTAFV